MRRQLIAEAFVLLASVSNVCLADTTYNIVNYGQDGVMIGGTITTSVNDGPITAGDITGFNVVVTPPSEPSFTLTPSSSVYVQCSLLNADTSSLYLLPGQGGYFHLFSDAGWVVNLDYEDYYAPPYGDIDGDGLWVHDLSGNLLFNITADTGSIPYDPMTIATTAPEPGTLTLLGSAWLGLGGAFYLRRRRAKD